VFFEQGVLRLGDVMAREFSLDFAYSHPPMMGVTHASCCLDFFFRYI
jgi:hypothetical protein